MIPRSRVAYQLSQPGAPSSFILNLLTYFPMQIRNFIIQLSFLGCLYQNVVISISPFQLFYQYELREKFSQAKSSGFLQCLRAWKQSTVPSAMNYHQFSRLVRCRNEPKLEIPRSLSQHPASGLCKFSSSHWKQPEASSGMSVVFRGRSQQKGQRRGRPPQITYDHFHEKSEKVDSVRLIQLTRDSNQGLSTICPGS